MKTLFQTPSSTKINSESKLKYPRRSIRDSLRSTNCRLSRTLSCLSLGEKTSTKNAVAKIESLNDACILRILALLGLPDLLQMRMVSRQFYKLIYENPASLALPAAQRLCLIGSKTRGHCLPYSPRFLEHAGFDPCKLELPVNSIHRPLRLLCFHAISLNYLDVTDQLLRQLSRGNASAQRINTLELVNCRISASLEEIGQFICMHQTVHFIMEGAKEVGNGFTQGDWTTFLLLNPQLETLDLHFVGEKPLRLAISDKIVIKWCRQPFLPRILLFRNFCTEISTWGIYTLIEHFLHFCHAQPTTLLDVGLVEYAFAAELATALSRFSRFLRSYRADGNFLHLRFFNSKNDTNLKITFI